MNRKKAAETGDTSLSRKNYERRGKVDEEKEIR